MQSATIQAALDVLPTGEVVPAGHSVHDAMPVLVLYFPAAHAVHVFPEAHDISVRSTPFDISVRMAFDASRLRYSSTTKAPATSAFKKFVFVTDLPMYIASTVLSYCIYEVPNTKDKVPVTGLVVILITPDEELYLAIILIHVMPGV